MNTYLTILLPALFFVVDDDPLARTLLCVREGDTLFAGTNTNRPHPHTEIRSVLAENGKFGAVYFEARAQHGWSQRGVNDDGLSHDRTATALLDAKGSTEKPRVFTHWLEQVLRLCATVDEALRVADMYNLQFM
jgi:hypothetical protein